MCEAKTRKRYDVRHVHNAMIPANSQQFRLLFLSLHQNQVLDRKSASLKCDYVLADESVRVDPSSSNLTLVMKRFLNVSVEAT